MSLLIPSLIEKCMVPSPDLYTIVLSTLLFCMHQVFTILNSRLRANVFLRGRSYHCFCGSRQICHCSHRSIFFTMTWNIVFYTNYKRKKKTFVNLLFEFPKMHSAYAKTIPTYHRKYALGIKFELCKVFVPLLSS